MHPSPLPNVIGLNQKYSVSRSLPHIPQYSTASIENRSSNHDMVAEFSIFLANFRVNFDKYSQLKYEIIHA